MIINGKVYTVDNLFWDTVPMKLGAGDVFQVSESTVIFGGEMPSHIQACDEIVCAISGTADVLVNGEALQLSGGQILYIKKGCTHSFTVTSKNFRYICIGFNPDCNYTYSQRFYERIKNKSFLLLDDSGNVRIISEMLLNEFYTNDSYSTDMINLYISQILITIDRGYEVSKKTPMIKKGDNESSYFSIYHILRYIDREFLTINSLRDLSEKTSYSESYLSHLFKEKIGVSIMQYILRKKLLIACRFLETTDFSINDIAESLNFKSSHIFCEAFKKKYSVTPSVYRKQKRLKK